MKIKKKTICLFIIFLSLNIFSKNKKIEKNEANKIFEKVSVVEKKSQENKKEIIIPEHLKPGDTIGIIAPANYSNDSSKYEIDYLIEKGFNIVYGKSFGNSWYGFGATDDIRANDINEMFANKDIKAIFAIRGGYGTIRIVDKLDYEMIEKNPKIFMGYSDITTLLLAINEKTGLFTYHGPMTVNFKDIPIETENSFVDTILNNNKINLLDYEKNYSIMKNGITSGQITGGNLSLIIASLGTKYEINTDDKILFLEETNEATYRIDRMLQQLKLAGKLDKVKGIILGNFKNAKRAEKDDMSLNDVFLETFKDMNIPIIKDFKSGHVRPFITVPIGAVAKINTYKNEIIIEKPSK